MKKIERTNCDGKNIFVVKNLTTSVLMILHEISVVHILASFVIVLQSLYFTIDSLYENCWKIFDEKFLLVKL